MSFDPHKPHHHIPHVGSQANKLEQEEDRMRQLMQQPGMAEKMRAAAEELAKNFNSSTRLITDIRAGALFRDQFTKKLYAYEYITQGFPHDIRSKIIAREAKQDFKDLPPTDLYMVIYEAESNPSPRYIIPALDFCKYFAIGIWQLVDPNNAEEKEFLDKVRRD